MDWHICQASKILKSACLGEITRIVSGYLARPSSRLGAVSSVVEHFLDTEGVTGSNPVSRTISSNSATKSVSEKSFILVAVDVTRLKYSHKWAVFEEIRASLPRLLLFFRHALSGGCLGAPSRQMTQRFGQLLDCDRFHQHSRLMLADERLEFGVGGHAGHE